jgi:steroid delta-isomerase-like uncharacterized protein
VKVNENPNVTSGLRTVHAFFDAYRAHDVEAMVEACSEQAGFAYVPVEVWGKQRVIHGDGKVRSVGKVFWTGLIESFPDLTNEVTLLQGDDAGNVVAEVMIRGTQRKPWGPIDSAGKAFAVPHLFLFRLDDGDRIDDVRAYWDSADMHRQLGHREVD